VILPNFGNCACWGFASWENRSLPRRDNDRGQIFTSGIFLRQMEGFFSYWIKPSTIDDCLCNFIILVQIRRKPCNKYIFNNISATFYRRLMFSTYLWKRPTPAPHKWSFKFKNYVVFSLIFSSFNPIRKNACFILTASYFLCRFCPVEENFLEQYEVNKAKLINTPN